MNAASHSTEAKELSLGQTAAALFRYHVFNRTALAIVALAVIGAGLALNWSWLVAAGIAPILVALAPCAAMCALGLCMGRMGGKWCAKGADTRNGEGAADKGPK